MLAVVCGPYSQKFVYCFTVHLQSRAASIVPVQVYNTFFNNGYFEKIFLENMFILVKDTMNLLVCLTVLEQAAKVII